MSELTGAELNNELYTACGQKRVADDIADAGVSAHAPQVPYPDAAPNDAGTAKETNTRKSAHAPQIPYPDAAVANAEPMSEVTAPAAGGAAKPAARPKNLALFATKNITLMAILTGLVVGGKYVLQLVGNVEVVTIFLILFTCTLGFFRTMIITLVFCALDLVLYQFSTSVLASYFFYWPLLVCVTKLVNLKKVRSEYVNAALAAVMSFLFGVITTFFDMLILGMPFVPRYLAGIVFFAIHIGSNFVIVLLLFKPLYKLLTKLKKQFRF